MTSKTPVSWGFVMLSGPEPDALSSWCEYCAAHCPKFLLPCGGALYEFTRGPSGAGWKRKEFPHILRRMAKLRTPQVPAKLVSELLGKPTLFAPAVQTSRLQLAPWERTVALQLLLDHLDDRLDNESTDHPGALDVIVNTHMAASFALKYSLLLGFPHS